MKIFLTVIISLTLFSSSFAQWQIGGGANIFNKAGRFSEATLPFGGGVVLTARTPSFLGSKSDWFLNSGLVLEGGGSGMKTIEINDHLSRTYDNCTIAQSIDMRFGRNLNNFKGYTEVIAGHFRIHSGYGETDNKLADDEQEGGRAHLSNSRVLRYGLGLGVGYQFTDEFKLEFSTRFTRGGAVDYLDMKSIRLLEVGTTNVGHTIKSAEHIDLVTFGITALFTGWR